MEFTPAQKTAIDYPDRNLLLSAAAGSGKTATLTERILHLLEREDTSLSRMLIVTYTRAAAAELRGRIGQKITEAAKKTGSRKMARHLTELPGAQISTIHAFLYRTLRPFFATLGLTPDFTIGDEAIIDALRQEAMQDTLDDFFHAGDPDFIALADTLAVSRDTEALDRTLLSIYDSITSAGETPTALERYAMDLAGGNDLFAMPQGKPIENRLRAATTHYQTALSRLHMEFDENVEKAYGAALQSDLDWLTGLDAALDTHCYANLRQWLKAYSPARLGRILSKNATDASEAFKVVREALKKDIAHFAGSFFSDTPELVQESIERTSALLLTTARVLSAYADTFRSRKMSRSLLDYSDLEALALRLFLDENGDPTAAAREIGRQFSHIFVDEYQDTNRVQDAIFRALGQESPRFMVGDSKQSIYRFRGAEPSVFARYRETWQTLTPPAPGTTMENATNDEAFLFSPDDGRCLFMSENFRCDRTVVAFVNLVSSYLFPCSAMPYTAADALVFGKGSGEATAAEIVLVEKPSSREDEDAPDTEDEDTLDPEAEYVAERIAHMLTEATDTPLTPKDFAILLRSPDTNGAAYRDALSRRGIPVAMAGGSLLFTSPAVQLVMCLLHVADNPLYDIPTAGAMHSPLFGFATHELVLLRDHSRKVLKARYTWENDTVPDMPLFTLVQMAVDENWHLPGMEVQTAETDAWDNPTAPLENPVPAVAPETDSVENPACPADNCVFSAEKTTDPSENSPSPVEIWKTSVDNSADSGTVEGTDRETMPIPSLDSELVEKCRVFLHAVTELREMAYGMRADRFLDTLYRQYGLLELPEIRDNAVEKNNLLALYDLARRYESGAFGGIGGFLTYTAELQSKKQAENEEGGIPAVQILSIHRAKGLEFPVVFVSSCSKKRNSRDEMGDILYDPDLGFGMRLPDTGGYARCGTALRAAIAEKKRLESIEEEMRVVYVALTRARNRLIVTGKVQDTEKFLAKCRFAAEHDSPYSVTGNRNYLEWITTAALVHGPDPCYRVLTVCETDTAVAEEVVTVAETVHEETDAAVWQDKLSDNLTYRYPHAHLTTIPAKLSVSQLHEGILDEERVVATSAMAEDTFSAGAEGDAAVTPDFSKAANTTETPLPRFLTGTIRSLSAADRGTATHMFLQFASFQNLAEQGAAAELSRLVEEHYLEARLAEGVYLTQIERFRASSLFERMRTSPECFREFRFNAPIDASRFTNDPELAARLGEEQVQLLVQGVVDCVFREPDGTLTLVDYKTDRPTAAEYKDPTLADASFCARHRDQLTLYRELCTRLFDEEIHQTILYSTVLGREIWVE